MAAEGKESGEPARCRRPRMVWALALLALAVAPAAAHAQDADAVRQELADRYAPVMLLQMQEHECDSTGEPYIPMAVDAVLDNPQVALRQLGSDDPVVMWGPTASDLYGLGEGFYLDYPGRALEPGCLYERDSRRFNADHQPTVYAHIVEPTGEDQRLVLEYWFFWYFNDWNNKHEGDWEGIQVVFPASTVEEALRVEPIGVGYAQHEGGEQADWTGDELDRDGSRPIVYPSAGSHASYLGSAVFLGRGASEGFGCDDTGGDTTRIDPEVVVLPDAAEGPDDPFAWLAFQGRWGEQQSGPFNGPTGPATKGRWLHPLGWQDDLRNSSVVVPAGDSQLSALVDAFCGAVEFGSNQLIAFQLSPTRAVVTVAVLVGAVWFVIRRTSWRPADPLPLVQPRKAGQIITAALTAVVRAWWLFLAIGLAAIPLGLLAGVLANIFTLLPLIGDIIELSESDGWSRLLVSLLAGGATSVFTYVFVAAAAAWVTAELSAGRPPTARQALRAVIDQWRDLASGFGRALAIVVLLFIPVIGIPFAVRQLVRYQFLPQVVMLEGFDGPSALRRSSSLVKHRWWHTAWMVVVIHVGATTAVVAIGLIVLVALQLPFWALSACIALAEVLAIPLAATAVTFLYGNAVSSALASPGAEEQRGEPGEGGADGDALEQSAVADHSRVLIEPGGSAPHGAERDDP